MSEGDEVLEVQIRLRSAALTGSSECAPMGQGTSFRTAMAIKFCSNVRHTNGMLVKPSDGLPMLQELGKAPSHHRNGAGRAPTGMAANVSRLTVGTLSLALRGYEAGANVADGAISSLGLGE